MAQRSGGGGPDEDSPTGSHQRQGRNHPNFSANEKKYLENKYQTLRAITSADIAAIAAEMSVDISRVKNWMQNRRAKDSNPQLRNPARPSVSRPQGGSLGNPTGRPASAATPPSQGGHRTPGRNVAAAASHTPAHQQTPGGATAGHLQIITQEQKNVIASAAQSNDALTQPLKDYLATHFSDLALAERLFYTELRSIKPHLFGQTSQQPTVVQQQQHQSYSYLSPQQIQPQQQVTPNLLIPVNMQQIQWASPQQMQQATPQYSQTATPQYTQLTDYRGFHASTPLPPIGQPPYGNQMPVATNQPVARPGFSQGYVTPNYYQPPASQSGNNMYAVQPGGAIASYSGVDVQGYQAPPSQMGYPASRMGYPASPPQGPSRRAAARIESPGRSDRGYSPASSSSRGRGRRKRIHFTAAQKKAMDESYEQDPNPPNDECQRILRDHFPGLKDINPIKNYFKNRRAKDNKSRATQQGKATPAGGGGGGGSDPDQPPPPGPRSPVPRSPRATPRRGGRRVSPTSNASGASTAGSASPNRDRPLRALSRIRRGAAATWIYPLPTLSRKQQTDFAILKAHYNNLLEPEFRNHQEWSDEVVTSLAEKYLLDRHVVDMWYLSKCASHMLAMCMVAQLTGPTVTGTSPSKTASNASPPKSSTSELTDQQFVYQTGTSPGKVVLSPGLDSRIRDFLGDDVSVNDQTVVGLAQRIDTGQETVQMYTERHSSANRTNVSPGADEFGFQYDHNQQEADYQQGYANLEEIANPKTFHAAVALEEFLDFQQPSIQRGATSPQHHSMSQPGMSTLADIMKKVGIPTDSDAVESESNDYFKRTVVDDGEKIVSTTQEIHQTVHSFVSHDQDNQSQQPPVLQLPDDVAAEHYQLLDAVETMMPHTAIASQHQHQSAGSLRSPGNSAPYLEQYPESPGDPAGSSGLPQRVARQSTRADKKQQDRK